MVASKLAYQEAREQAQGLLDSDAWDRQYPVKLLPFLKFLDASLTEEPELGSNQVSGMVIKDNENSPAQIYINTSETYPRQRFTLAHEMGHLVERLQRKDGEYSFMDMRSNNHYDLHEFYADEFAGALLMPEAEILRLQKEHWTVPRMAAHFNVTVAAVAKRLERLEKNPS